MGPSKKLPRTPSSSKTSPRLSKKPEKMATALQVTLQRSKSSPSFQSTSLSLPMNSPLPSNSSVVLSTKSTATSSKRCTTLPPYSFPTAKLEPTILAQKHKLTLFHVDHSKPMNHSTWLTMLTPKKSRPSKSPEKSKKKHKLSTTTATLEEKKINSK